MIRIDTNEEIGTSNVLSSMVIDPNDVLFLHKEKEVEIESDKLISECECIMTLRSGQSYKINERDFESLSLELTKLPFWKRLIRRLGM